MSRSTSSTTPLVSADADAPKHRRAGWVHTPTRTKLTLIILLALVGGCLIGMVETREGNQVWPMMIGLGLLAAALISLVHRSVCEPLEDVLEAARRARRTQRPAEARRLPLQRDDELGDLSKILCDLTMQAYRHSTTVNRLRRTLDARVAKATHRATSQLQQLAMRDPLTNLGNRRFLDTHLTELVDTCRATGTDLICIVIDMDNFKSINDRFGHAVGDKMLSFLAQLIRANVRGDDYAVRLGGDEFLVLMPGAGDERARHFTERVPSLFAHQMRTMLPRDVRTGLSMGVASLQRDHLETGAALIEHADDNLYQAKDAGKGCTCGM